jgi:hypothetical protein
MKLPWTRREFGEAAFLFASSLFIGFLFGILGVRDGKMVAWLGIGFGLGVFVAIVWLCTARLRRPYYDGAAEPVTWVGPPSLRSIRVLMALSATSTIVMIAIAAIAASERWQAVLLTGLVLLAINHLMLLAWWKLARKKLEQAGMRW